MIICSFREAHSVFFVLKLAAVGVQTVVPSQGTFVHVWRRFWLSQPLGWRGGWGVGRGQEHCSQDRSQSKYFLALNVSKVASEKAWCRSINSLKVGQWWLSHSGLIVLEVHGAHLILAGTVRGGVLSLSLRLDASTHLCPSDDMFHQLCHLLPFLLFAMFCGLSDLNSFVFQPLRGSMLVPAVL